MIITCEECQTKFRVADELIKETGTRVRCSNCHYVFTVFRPPAALDPDLTEPPPASEGNGPYGFGAFGPLGQDDLDRELDSLYPPPDPRPGDPSSGPPLQSLSALSGPPLKSPTASSGPPLESPSASSEPTLESPSASPGVGPRIVLGPGQAPIVIARPPYPAGTSPPAEPKLSFPVPGSRPAQGPDPSPGPTAAPFGSSRDDLGLGDEPVGRPAGPGSTLAANAPVEPNPPSPRGDPASLNSAPNLGPRPDQSLNQAANPGLNQGLDPSQNQGLNPESLNDPSHRLDPLWSNPGADPPWPSPGADSSRGPLAGASAPADQGLRLANREKTERRGRVFWLTASVAIAFLLIALLFMSIWRQPETVALQTDRPAAPAAPEALTAPPAQAAPAAQAGPAVPEPEPILLNFVQDRESHHYRVNKTAGRILIIAGLVANGYPDRRSFIRIKGALRDSRQEVVAERQAFAGNYLTEEELSDLPMPEILARLALKGGKDNANVNVPPGQAVPFMLVFDRLPDDLAAYVLEPVGSVPAGPGQGNPG